jgi:cell volume regulation protein A
MGIISGLIWLPIMHKVRREQFSYVATLAVVFIVYALTASIVTVADGGEGAGAIACLVFGLVLGNGRKVLKMIGYSEKRFELDELSKHSHSLISFIIRTFFFVFLGMMVGFQRIEYIIIGIVVLLLLLGVRVLATLLATFKGGFERDDRQSIMVMMPRGLAAAILAINFGPELVSTLMPGMEGFFEDVAFVVILGTAIICTVGISLICHYEKQLNTVKESSRKESTEHE